MIAPDSLALAGIAFLIVTCVGMLTGAVDRLVDGVRDRASPAEESKG